MKGINVTSHLPAYCFTGQLRGDTKMDEPGPFKVIVEMAELWLCEREII
jgi:hypothetical protein